ncbi:hypothetical protein chiPu_0027573, partial [Chiloscyllium punctatum]|nr:hypothetical protein [Chiloscyllium punctatum]
MQTTIEDLQWDTDKIRKREQRLNRHLAEVLERVKSKGYKVYGGSSNLYGGTVTINARKVLFPRVAVKLGLGKDGQG